MVHTAHRRRAPTTTNSRPPPKDCDDDDVFAYKETFPQRSICVSVLETIGSIKTPPNGSKKRSSAKLSSARDDRHDPLLRAQCYRTDLNERQRPISRRGIPAQESKKIAATFSEMRLQERAGKRQKRDSSSVLSNNDGNQVQSTIDLYTIPRKSSASEMALKLAREKHHERSPLKNGKQSAMYARQVSEGLRKHHHTGMAELFEDGCIMRDDVANETSESQTSYDTQEKNSSTLGSPHSQGATIHTDQAICSSPSKDIEDDDVCEIIQVEIAAAQKENRSSFPTRVIREEKMHRKTPPQTSSRGLFGSLSKTAASNLSPDLHGKGICCSMSVDNEIENVLATVSKEPVRSEAQTSVDSTAGRVLSLLIKPVRDTWKGLKLTKARKGKPLNVTTTSGLRNSVVDFFKKDEGKTHLKSDPIVDDDDQRGATSVPQYRQHTKRRRSNRLTTGPENPIEIDDSDEDVTSIRHSMEGTASRRFDATIDLARVTVGSQYSHTDCKLELKDDHMLLCYTIKKKRHSERPTKARHVIDFHDVKEFHHFVPAGEDFVLAILRVEPSESNGFNKASKYLRSIDKEIDRSLVAKKGYIVLDFHLKGSLKRLLEWMGEHSSLQPYLLEPGATLASLGECEEYAEIMLGHIQSEQGDTEDNMSSPSTRIKRRGNKSKSNNSDSKEILLVFPFDADEGNIDAAAESLTEVNRVIEQADVTRKIGLAEASGSSYNGWPAGKPRINVNATILETLLDHSKDQSSSSDSDAGIEAMVEAGITDEAKKKVRAHYLTIRREDTDRLEPGEFLNDTLIDFWMEWLMRKEDRESSPLHIFSSHFYTTLSEEGTGAVESWTARKNIDIFKKRFVFLPINKSLHWSLCVVVNPAYIRNGSGELDTGIEGKTEPFPCILFLDSLKAHRKDLVARHVRKWLNAEWKRLMAPLHGCVDPFSASTLPVYTPRIPYQDNCWDCGVFVCRYAYALFMLRHKVLTVAGHTSPGDALRDAITERDEFQFDMDDIVRIRKEMKILIDNLAECYRNLKATPPPCETPITENNASVAERKSPEEDALPRLSAGEDNDSHTMWLDADSHEVDDFGTPFDVSIKQEYNEDRTYI